MVLKKSGFTLIEFLVVMSIIAIMALILFGTLNPVAMVDKANDARRKKDLNRLRVAFEEYFNDKSCYPRIDQLGVCGQNWSSLSSWPCDPNGGQYIFVIENSPCPHSYKIFTNLRNKNDKDIPKNWYTSTAPYQYGIGSTITYTRDQINYGVSSAESTWDKVTLPSKCTDDFKSCFHSQGPGDCQAIPPGTSYDTYTDRNCSPECLVDCCVNGHVCNQ